MRPPGQKERRFRHLPIGRKRVERVMPIPRVECENCGARRQIAIPFADPPKRYSRPLARYVVEVSRQMTVLDVAEHLEMSWDTVKENQKQHWRRHYARPQLKHLRRIAIDEIAVKKGHHYLMVVFDRENGAVVFVGNGKSATAKASSIRLIGGMALTWERLREGLLNYCAIPSPPAPWKAPTTRSKRGNGKPMVIAIWNSLALKS